MYRPGTTGAVVSVADSRSGPPAAPVSVRPARPAPQVRRPAGAPPGGAVFLPLARVAGDPPCASDPDLFFAESPADVESAKALCRDCRIQRACLSGARERREPWGVWGGELFLRGEVVPRKRPRGRPRKADIAA
jgi:WhiB family redox-sensing transcriptional regulator